MDEWDALPEELIEKLLARLNQMQQQRGDSTARLLGDLASNLGAWKSPEELLDWTAVCIMALRRANLLRAGRVELDRRAERRA